MGVVLLLLTVSLTLLAAVLLVASGQTKRFWLRNFVVGALVIWYAGYFGALLSASLLSREKTLGLNEPKKFCGFSFDCRLSASVVGVRRAGTFGRLRAANEFRIVRVRFANDAASSRSKI